jgi:hypothetical protein
LSILRRGVAVYRDIAGRWRHIWRSSAAIRNVVWPLSGMKAAGKRHIIAPLSARKQQNMRVKSANRPKAAGSAALLEASAAFFVIM